MQHRTFLLHATAKIFRAKKFAKVNFAKTQSFLQKMNFLTKEDRLTAGNQEMADLENLFVEEVGDKECTSERPRRCSESGAKKYMDYQSGNKN